MKKRVGIPRALFYYKHYILWETFFKELDVEVIVSEHTNKEILDNGVKTCIDEACLPIKTFFGHVINIKDKVDYLFIPRYTSISKNQYICPKFGGLPDMIRSSFQDLPTIIDTEINLRKSKGNAKKAIMEIGSYITDDKVKVKKAFKIAFEEYEKFKNNLKQGIIPSKFLDKKKVTQTKFNNRELNIVVIGHVYNIYDNYTNMDLIYKLKNNNVNVMTIDSMDKKVINERTKLLEKQMFWNFGSKALGSTLEILDKKNVDGVIYLMNFGCGIDSFICDLIERMIRKNSNIPFTILTFDEQSGEAGINTRIEAFIDMIRWRDKDEINISTHGKSVYCG